MQTADIPKKRALWPEWAEFLHRYGMGDLVAWALEAAGPLMVLGAQVLYFGGPLLRPVLSNGQVDALAGFLEDRNETDAFAVFLREEGSL